ncbi:hypothetical protein ACHAXT_000357 [Thalassiosira profunda]
MTDARTINLHDFIVQGIKASGIFPLSAEDTQEFSPEARLERAAKLKDDGTKEFMAGNYSSAEKLYRKAAEQLTTGSSSPLPDELALVFTKCAANAAMCFMKDEEWGEVIACCDQALDTAPDHAKSNIKILYRRGVAKMRLSELDEAQADLTAAYQLDNANKDVRKALKELKPKLSKLKKKEKQQFEGIFGRVSMYEEKTVDLFRITSAKGGELTRLPDTVLATMAEFLTKTERALTAVAMTAPASSWKESNWKKQPCEASRVMAMAKPLAEINLRGRNWLRNYHRTKSYDMSFLDFEDIDKKLATKLSDADVGGVLVCIDAVNTLKKLKLHGCTGIRGSGLEPLRGSLALEQIDLSLAMKSKTLILPPDIRADAVIPILDSIVEDERSCLKHIQLPKKWRDVRSRTVSQFLPKYNRALNNREMTCDYCLGYNDPKCGAICRTSEEDPWIPQSGAFWGIQHHSCYECTKTYCEEHSEEETPHVCEVCEKMYCVDCNQINTCDICDETTCGKCSNIERCADCDGVYCGNCCQVYWCDGCDDQRCEECVPFIICEQEGCPKGNCMECTSGEEEKDWGVKFCSSCDATFCVVHLALKLQLCDDEPCEECLERVLSMLLDRNERILRQLHVWEKSCGYEELFETDLETEDVSALFGEQKRLKDRWNYLYEKSTDEQRKERKFQVAKALTDQHKGANQGKECVDWNMVEAAAKASGVLGDKSKEDMRKKLKALTIKGKRKAAKAAEGDEKPASKKRKVVQRKG